MNRKLPLYGLVRLGTGHRQRADCGRHFAESARTMSPRPTGPATPCFALPGVLDVDPALGPRDHRICADHQFRNTELKPVHDGVIWKMASSWTRCRSHHRHDQYFERTRTMNFLARYVTTCWAVRSCPRAHSISTHPDSTTPAGLRSDQYRKQRFSTYDNVLVWRAMLDWQIFLSDERAQQKRSRLLSALIL